MRIFLLLTVLFSINMVWGQTSPINESFSNLGPYGGYQTETWTGDDGGTWTATDARTDQTINGKAIAIRNGTLTSPTVSGGIGSLTVTVQRVFSGGSGDMTVTVNGSSVGTIAYDATQQTVSINNINISGNVVVVIDATNSSSDRVALDDLQWTAYSSGGNSLPLITNISQTPTEDITSSTTVSVSADVTDSDGTISSVELHWGTSTGSLGNTISMSNGGSGDTYTTSSDIPAQSNGTTVYYEIYAEDNSAGTRTSSEQNYKVMDPLTTTLPYSETFDSDLSGVYTKSVSGDTKEWLHNSGDASASINGFNSGDTEEDWLILPAINFDNYSDEIFTFDSWYRFGTDDVNNYLKLYYSTDYSGIGDPTTFTWTELTYTQPSTDQSWTSSGSIDLSGIAGTSVYIGFKYRYESDSYRWWQLDNFNIQELSLPTITVNPSTLSGFSYFEGSGPSAEQSFTVSGLNLTNDISLAPPTNYEISTGTGGSFSATNPITLSQSGGTVSSTTIYVRLKSGLSDGMYLNEDITAASTGATSKTVTCNGSVASPPSLVINEILADPDGTTGDANGDGTVDAEDDEFVEIINISGSTINLGGYTLRDGFDTRHTFADPTDLPAGHSITVFGGGTPTNIPGFSVVASSGALGLNNGGDVVTLQDGSSTTIDSHTYAGEAGDNQSIAREPDITGGFVKHTTIVTNSVAFSPGRDNTDNSELPVELISFRWEIQEATVVLSWTTATEVNNYGFEVERQKAEDGSQSSDWINIGFVQGAGNSNSPKNYSFVDENPLAELMKYRLKQIDTDGSFEYYETILEVDGTIFITSVDNENPSTDGPTEFALEQNYPNPFNPSTQISYSLPDNGSTQHAVSLRIYDLLGRHIATLVNTQQAPGNYIVNFDATSVSRRINSGIYFYKLQTQKFTSIKKMLFIK
jgi:hypothetical protein